MQSGRDRGRRPITGRLSSAQQHRDQAPGALVDSGECVAGEPEPDPLTLRVVAGIRLSSEADRVPRWVPLTGGSVARTLVTCSTVVDSQIMSRSTAVSPAPATCMMINLVESTGPGPGGLLLPPLNPWASRCRPTSVCQARLTSCARSTSATRGSRSALLLRAYEQRRRELHQVEARASTQPSQTGRLGAGSVVAHGEDRQVELTRESGRAAV